ncbi:hypothetical protein PsYK624_096840 [Phanerochaete sordida]|uniref:Uncharacterized protein n=1 Tax=Phanerochaete sordida TaxID=48140 RepID=A0A9P3GGZ9_9APHY|nr:hypothetical protein PsYK624_096840 [Phanerochaete sordida]
MVPAPRPRAHPWSSPPTGTSARPAPTRLWMRFALCAQHSSPTLRRNVQPTTGALRSGSGSVRAYTRARASLSKGDAFVPSRDSRGRGAPSRPHDSCSISEARSPTAPVARRCSCAASAHSGIHSCTPSTLPMPAPAARLPAKISERRPPPPPPTPPRRLSLPHAALACRGVASPALPDVPSRGQTSPRRRPILPFRVTRPIGRY